MSILDWFKDRNRLIRERNNTVDALDKVNSAIETAESLEQLKEWNSGKTPKVMILEGSDIGLGELRLQGWAIKVLATSLGSVLDKSGAVNYFSLVMKDPKTNKEFEVTLQRKEPGKLTPAEKATKLEKELQELKSKLTLNCCWDDE